MTLKLGNLRCEVFGQAAGRLAVWSVANNNWWTVHFFVKRAHRCWGHNPWDGFIESFGLGWLFLWVRC